MADARGWSACRGKLDMSDLRERFVSSTKLPYQLAPDKTTLKLQGMPTKTTRPTGTLPTGYDTGILIKVPDEQHVLHVLEPRYAEQHFPAAFTR